MMPAGRLTEPPIRAGERFASALRARREAAERFFEREEGRLARLCREMARRFARGGRLLALGAGPQSCSDARHVAVEFAHPVIVGKRALPALAVEGSAGPLARQVDLLARADDIVMVFPDPHAELERVIACAAGRNCLTVGMPCPGAVWSFDPGVADAFVRQELTETAYHVLWELVHVFFEHPGLLDAPGAKHDAGGARFLYPFLGHDEHDAADVLSSVRASISMKARETTELRAATLEGSGDALLAAASTLTRSFAAGGTLFALGNGGSATDAQDLVADLAHPPRGRPAHAALDLGQDPSILTAVGNDVGIEAIFSRQVIAYGRVGDVVVAFSTSGSSRNVVRALEEARARGLATVAFVGHDGGLILDGGLADHVIHSPSEHVPRVQEAQATAYHMMCEAVWAEAERA